MACRRKCDIANSLDEADSGTRLAWDEGRPSQNRIRCRKAHFLNSTEPLGGSEMTATDTAILLIILCALLWAIMAALHKQTATLDELRAQMQVLLKTDTAETSRGLRNEISIRQDAQITSM